VCRRRVHGQFPSRGGDPRVLIKHIAHEQIMPIYMWGWWVGGWVGGRYRVTPRRGGILLISKAGQVNNFFLTHEFHILRFSFHRDIMLYT